ncbi:MAG: SHOCT domain-containing protein [Anaerolineae bacterium]|nr:SHOCT domain-containing protein [Anaerolineae bacterium]
MMGLGLGMGLFGFFWMLLFWGGLIALAVWLIRLLFPSAQAQSDNHNEETLSAPEILKTHYAQGELTAEQYQEMLQTIRQ